MSHWMATPSPATMLFYLRGTGFNNKMAAKTIRVASKTSIVQNVVNCEGNGLAMVIR